MHLLVDSFAEVVAAADSYVLLVLDSAHHHLADGGSDVLGGSSSGGGAHGLQVGVDELVGVVLSREDRVRGLDLGLLLELVWVVVH